MTGAKRIPLRPIRGPVRAEPLLDTAEVLAVPVADAHPRYAPQERQTVRPGDPDLLSERRGSAMNHRPTRTPRRAVPADTPQLHESPMSPEDVRDALLSPEGGGGAQLRGHVPDAPEGVVLVLHGGAEHGRSPVSWWRLAVLRMLPFATAIEHEDGDRLAVLRLKDRVRGWNGTRQDPVHDARWALERIRRVLPGVPVALVGHSMGGRVVLQLAAEPDVAAVAALAPWIEETTRRPRRGTPVLLMHGTRDRMTDPRRTAIVARRWEDAGADVEHIEVEDESHSMLRQAGYWHETVATFVSRALLGPGRTS